MANSVKGEDRVGSNSSSLSTTASSLSQSSSPVASSTFVSSPTVNGLSSSAFFQSISAELDGHVKACPPTTTSIKSIISSSANSTESGASSLASPLLFLPKWESCWWWQRRRWCSHPVITTTSATLPSSTTSNINRSACVTTAAAAFRLEDHPCKRVLRENNRHQHSPLHNRHHHHRQRLNSLTIHLIVVLVFTTTFACFPSLAGSTTSGSLGQEENESLVCMKGVSGNIPGVTYPRGDIFMKEGDTLEVFCKLNLTNPIANGYNASNIDFKITKAHIPQEQVEKQVLNETTAVIRVKHMNASTVLLRCVINRTDGTQAEVCLNHIEVGYPPLPVENFRCISYEWKNLNCTWKLPPNPVKTDYTISHRWYNRHDAFCPKGHMTKESCIWDKYTIPHYRPGTDPVYIRVNGTNALKPLGLIWDFKFSLGTIVIPEKPTLQPYIKLSPSQYMLNWTFENFEYYGPGLNHQLSICYTSDDKPICNTTFYETRVTGVTEKMAPYLAKNVTLLYPHMVYNISVRLRSRDANKTEEFWSKPDNMTILTDSRAPDFPPETDISSFEISSSQSYRHVYIYWKSLPEHYRNGPNFNYTIDVYENKSVLLNIEPDELRENYAKFNTLKTTSSYYFYITAYNSEGKSKNASEITLLPADNLPGEPQLVSKTDLGNGSFEISWKKPSNSSGIVSYTVFRCVNKIAGPYPCTSRMKWDRVVSKNETLQKFYDNLPKDVDYQFAVSANTDKSGSGMVWSYCSLIHGRGPRKLQNVRYEEPSEFEIVINWKLDCVYRSGDIEAFKITYCPVEKIQGKKCKDDEKSVAVEGANMTRHRLVGLEPYTIYMVYVSVLSAAGTSPKSEPIYPKTLESAPSTATVFNVSQLTNVSAVLDIKPPNKLNGILRRYQIVYGTSNKDSKMETVHLNWTNVDTQVKKVELKNLKSSSNYTVYIVACTTDTKCSEKSEPFSFRTDIGVTDLTAYPNISWADGKMVLEWNKPDHTGGPIYSFQVRLKKNGEEVTVNGDYPVEMYQKDVAQFRKQITQTCEPGTTFTAEIRAVTLSTSGDYLNGAWSNPGNYRCGGKPSGIVWVILVVVAIIALTVFGYLSFRGYNYFRKMKDGLAIKLPPGLNSELNGFTHKPPPRSRSSDNGKEMYAYPLQPTGTQDESKDFLSSHQGEAEESLIEKPYCPSPTNPLLGGSDFSQITTGSGDSRTGNPLEDDEHDIRLELTDFDNIHSDQCSSPSTYTKLGVHSNGTAVLIEPMPGPSSRSTPSIKSDSCGDLSTSSPSNTISQISNHLPHLPSTPTLSKIPISSTSQSHHIPNHHPPHKQQSPSMITSNGINRTVPDVLSSSPSSPTATPSLTSSIFGPQSTLPQQNGVPPSLPPLMNGISHSSPVSLPVVPPQPTPAPVQPNSSYVKWTTLVPDMKTGDAGGVLENGSRQSPYCQVGILLDS